MKKLVGRILATVNGSRWEREIASQPRKVFPKTWTSAIAAGGDQLASALHGLTPEEIQIVEGAAK